MVDGVGIAGLVKGIYDALKERIPVFDLAYDRALRKWAANNSVRRRFSDNYLSDFDRLVEYAKDDSSVDQRFLDFFKKLLDEVKADPQLNSALGTEFSMENYRVGRKLTEEIAYVRSVVDRLAVKEPLLREEYKDVEDYIPLAVTCDETEEERLRRILAGRGDTKSLTDMVVEGNKRLILFSHPQHGKSTVLAKLAYDLQQSGIFRPYLFNLRNYSSTSSLVAQMKLEQRLENSPSSVLILDGLDELKEEQRENVVSEISVMSSSYPEMVMVLSCRLSHKSFTDVLGFDSVYLESINYRTLEDYVRGHCADPDAFLEAAMASGLMRFLYVPFFLKESLSYFDKYGRIPADEIAIYEFFIDRSFDADRRRKNNRNGCIGPKARLYGHLEHMAFVMLASQRMELSPEEMTEAMGIGEDVVGKLMELSLITRGDGGELTFVHNAFKEYILAKKLAQLDSERIRQMVCYPGTDLLIPALRNVVVLMIRLVCDGDGWNASGFRDWFVAKYPDVLVDVGPECLDERSRESIFESVFNDHKRKELHIGYGYTRGLMTFASTPGSVRFLVNELESSETLDANCMNALRLAEYADFSLLADEECGHVREVMLQMLGWDGLKIEDYYYLGLPFRNASVVTAGFIERTLDAVRDTRNCYVIETICRMAMALGLSDRYADWVLSKAGYVRNYDLDGVTHVVSNHDLMDFIRSLCDPVNILKALRHVLPDERCHMDTFLEKDAMTLVPGLLKRLSSCGGDDVWKEVVRIIDDSYLDKISEENHDAFRSYFESATDADALFDDRTKAFLEDAPSGKRDYLDEMRMRNLLSILLNEDRLARLIEADKDGCFKVYDLLNHLEMYPVRTVREKALISDFVGRKFPKTQVRNMQQEQFDILFDREAFRKEIISIFDGKDRIDFGKDERRIFRGLFNWSVIWFLREVGEDEGEMVCLDAAMDFFNDEEKFLIYLADRFSHNLGESLKVSDEQRKEIVRIVRALVPVCGDYQALGYCLIRLVVHYGMELSAAEYRMLLPWAAMNIKEKQYYDGISYGERNFMDYIYEHLADRSVFVSWVRAALNGDFDVVEGFYVAVAKTVVKHRITDLYKSLRDMMQKFERDYERLNLAIGLLKTGRTGYELSQNLLDLLPEDDRLVYYEHLLVYENKGLVLTKDIIDKAVGYVEDAYGAYSEAMKQTSLRILFAHGRKSALEWGFDMFESNDKWIYVDRFPTMSGYTGDDFDALAKYFDKATTGERVLYPRPQPMYEAVAAALKNVAMESLEMLDKVKALFRRVADEKKEFKYYNRVADELDVEYYSRNVTPPDLRQASVLYRSQCCNP